MRALALIQIEDKQQQDPKVQDSTVSVEAQRI